MFARTAHELRASRRYNYVSFHIPNFARVPSPRVLLCSVLVAFLATSTLFVGTAAADSPVLQVDTTIVSGSPVAESTTATVRSGTSFSLVIKYVCASSAPCAGATITDHLPDELVVDQILTPSQVQSTEQTSAASVPSGEPGNRQHGAYGTATFHMIDPLPGGSTGQIQIKVRFPDYWTPDGTTAVNSAQMSASNAATVMSGATTSTASASQGTSAAGDQPNGRAIDQVTTIGVRGCLDYVPDGHLGIANAVLTAQLPTGAVFVSSSSGGTESSPGEVTFNMGDLATTQGCWYYSYDVRFPSTDPSNVSGAAKSHSVVMTGTPYGQPTPIQLGTATVPFVLVDPAPDAYEWKWVSTPRWGPGPVSPEAVPGESVSYSVSMSNQGNTLMDSAVVHDTVPVQLKLTRIDWGASQVSPSEMWIASTADPTLRLAATTPASTSGSFDPYAVTLPSGISGLDASDFVTDVELRSSTIGRNTGLALWLQADVLATDRAGVAVLMGDVVTNNSTMAATSGATTVNRAASADFVIRHTPAQPQPPRLDVTSWVSPGVIDSSTRVATTNINTWATNGGVTDPVIDHLLPADTTMTSWTSYGSLPVPTAVKTADFHGTGRTLVRFTWPAGTVLPSGNNVQLALNVRYGPTRWDVVANDTWATATVTPGPLQCGYVSTDSADVDEDGNSSEQLCGYQSFVTIQAIGVATVRTSMRGNHDVSFVSAPGLAASDAGAAVTERVSVTNSGTAPLDHVTVVEVVPTATDTAVGGPTPRNASGFSLVLDAAVDAPAGAIVSYTTTANPCRSEVGYSPGGCASPAWSTTLGSPAAVTAIKVEFDTAELDPGEVMSFDIPFVVPTGTPVGSVTRDSAAFSARRIDLASTLLPSESVAAGVRVPAGSAVVHGALYDDLNGSGVRDFGEHGVADVVILLSSAGPDGNFGTGDDQLVSTTETDSSGDWGFEVLDAGDYRATVDPFWINDQRRYASADPDAGTPDGHATVTLTNGVTLSGQDFGVAFRRVGDFVWNDANANGVQEFGESGIDGLRVDVRDNTNAIVESTVTGDDPTTPQTEHGWWSVRALAEGDYTIVVTPPSGFLASPIHRGSATFDSDIDSNGTMSVKLGNPNPDRRSDLDAGFVDPSILGSVAGRAWNDANVNGIQDAGETNLSGLTVRLRVAGTDETLDSGDDIERITSTDGTGSYSFTGVMVGAYRVTVDVPNGQSLTALGQGSNPDLDSDIDPQTHSSTPSQLALGEARSHLDIGLLTNGTIGLHSFSDLDHSGTFSAGDGVVGTGMSFYEVGPDGVRGTKDDGRSFGTGVWGDWSMSVEPGNWVLCANPQASTMEMSVLIAAHQGSDTSLDSDFDPLTNCTDPISVSSGQHRDDISIGYSLGDSSISVSLWKDDDGDGRRDAGESTGDSVWLYLYWAGPDGTMNTGDDRFIRSAYTQGVETFDDLVAGTYYVAGNAPNDTLWSESTATDPSLDNDFDPTNSRAVVTVSAGSSATIEGGFHDRPMIKGVVWRDDDHDGIHDSSEPIVSNVMVTLRWAGTDGTFDTSDDWTGQAYSDSSGYRFYTNAIGDHRVELISPVIAGTSMYTLSAAGAGADRTVDSDIDPITGRSSAIAVNGLQVIDHVDVGLLPGTGTISGRLFSDSNDSGVRDIGESNLAGWISLCDVGPDGMKQTKDDHCLNNQYTWSGAYSFDAVLPGSYYLTFQGPGDGRWSSQHVGNDSTVDSDVDSNGQTDLLAVTDSTAATDIDAGYVTLGSVTGSVWVDQNGDGIRQDGEMAPMNGVDVTLRSSGPDMVWQTSDDLVLTTTLWGSTNFQFNAVPPGTYRIEMPPPVHSKSGGASYLLVASEQGSDDTRDSDVDQSSGFSPEFTLALGQQLGDFGVGLLGGTGVISGAVWDDQNGDGIRQPSEPALSKVSVGLVDVGPDGIYNTKDDVFVSWNGTDGNGDYQFQGLLGGTYVATFGWVDSNRAWTAQHVGSDPTVDSDVDLNGNTDPVSLADGATVSHLDAGSGPRPTVGDQVWVDTNGNGLQDAGEPGLANVRVRLTTTGSDGVLGTQDDDNRDTWTDSGGRYSFDVGGFAGSARISVDPVITNNGSMYAITDQDVGSDEAVDSDANSSGNINFSLSGSPRDDLDIGFTPGSSSIGDRVWVDTNGDGIQDAGEPGLETWLALVHAGPDGAFGTNDDVEVDTSSDSSGYYQFDHLFAGAVRVSLRGEGRSLTTYHAGTDRSVDSDLFEALGRTPTITLADHEHRTDIDVGVSDTVVLQGRIWIDTNADGIRQAGEPAAAGAEVGVQMSGADGQFGTDDDEHFGMKTDNEGRYVLYAHPGQFRVVADLVTEVGGMLYSITTRHAGTDPDVDSDFDPSTGVGPSSPGGWGDAPLTADLGLRSGNGSISGQLWLDANGDGVRQDAENPVEKTSVSLVVHRADDGTQEVDRVQVDPDGSFRFDGLPPADYQLVAQLDSGLTFTLRHVGDPTRDSDFWSTSDETDWIAVGPSSSFDHIDGGVQQVSPLVGTVWLDGEGDGIRNNKDGGAGGVLVRVTGAGPDGVTGTPDDIDQATGTDSQGRYEFSSLPAGPVTISVGPVVRVGDINAFYSATLLHAGGDPTLDSDADASGSLSVVAGSSPDSAHDIGLVAGTGSLGDLVWNDLNHNGLQDAGEPGIEKAQVALTVAGPDGLWDTKDDGWIGFDTDSAGHFEFPNLPAGTYRVIFNSPDEWSNAPYRAGSDPNLDSDAKFATRSDDVVLAADQHRDDFDAGFMQVDPSSLLIWFDTDHDGVRGGDDTDPVAEGVPVWIRVAGFDQILGTADDLVFENDTEGDGTLSLRGIPIGGVRFSLNLPGGLEYVPVHAGSDPNRDSDLDPALGYLELYPTFGQTVTYAIGVQFSAHSASTPTTTTAPATTTAPTTTIAPTKTTIAPTTLPAGPTRVDPEVGDLVWLDRNSNGLRDADESGLSGVRLELRSHSGVVLATTVTDGSGHYLFAIPSPASYTVAVVGGLAAGLVEVSDPDATIDGLASATVGVGGGSVLNLDFGYRGTGSICANVNASSVGSTIELTGPSGIVVPITSTSSGTVCVDGLPWGSYSVTTQVEGDHGTHGSTSTSTASLSPSRPHSSIALSTSRRTGSIRESSALAFTGSSAASLLGLGVLLLGAGVACSAMGRRRRSALDGDDGDSKFT